MVDSQYPPFVLGGVIMDREHAEGQSVDALNESKADVFGRTDIILHTVDIARNRNGFEAMQDEAFRDYFYDRTNSLMRSLRYSVVACAICKDEHLSRYGLAAIDPYVLSPEVLVEIFCFEMGDVNEGGIVEPERRDLTLDRALELAWTNLKVRGTLRFYDQTVEDRISLLSLPDKKSNSAG